MLTMVLAMTGALAQGLEPLPREPGWWEPQTELRLRLDRITEADQGGVDRASAQLRLRWEGAGPDRWEGFRYAFGTRSALGSDGNRLNIRRWDQQPSNGTQVDVAHVGVEGRSERTFGDLRLGFQENRLLAPEALWDRDLRFLGLGLRMAGPWRGCHAHDAFRDVSGRAAGYYRRVDLGDRARDRAAPARLGQPGLGNHARHAQPVG